MNSNSSSLNNNRINGGSCSNKSIHNINKKEGNRSSSSNGSSSKFNSNSDSGTSSNKCTKNSSSSSSSNNYNGQSNHNSNDPFAIVFDVFQSLLSATEASDDVNNTKLHKVEDVLSALTEKELHDSAVSRLNYIRTMRKLTMKRLKSQFEMESCRVQAIESTYYQADSACLRHKDVISGRLAQQVHGTERRMKELVFEIIGEYAKSEERLSRRQDYLIRAAQLKIVGKVTKLRWQRFLLCLCSDSTLSSPVLSPGADSSKDVQSGHNIRSSVLCHLNDTSEISVVTGAVNRIAGETSLTASHPIKVITVVKLSRFHVPLKRRRVSNIATSPVLPGLTPIYINQSDLPARALPSDGSSQLYRNINDTCLISTTGDFLKAMGHIESWMRPDLNSNKIEQNQTFQRTAKFPNEKESGRSWNFSTKLLSSSPIEYLHPPSYFPSIWQQIHTDELRGVHVHRTESDPLDTNRNRNRSKSDSDSGDGDNSQLDETGRISDFVKKFTLQHSSFVSSDRVYFCLEERALATRHRGILDPEGGREEESPSEEQKMLDIYSYLQGQYASSSPITPTESLRHALTAQPMYVTESASSHTAECGGHLGGPKGDRFRSAVQSFPNVIKVSNTHGDVLHFAPACPLNIFESSGLHKYYSDVNTNDVEGKREGKGSMERRNAAKEEWIARMSQSLSYPVVKGDSHQSRVDERTDPQIVHNEQRAGSPQYLDRLFCIVQVTPLHCFTPSTEDSPESSKSPTRRERERERKESGAALSDDSDCPRPLSYQVMMPLSDPCMSELVHAVLCAKEGSRTRARDALQLLPDQARYRISRTPALNDSNSSRSSPRAQHSCHPSEDHLDLDATNLYLKHKYVLLKGSEVSSDSNVQLEDNNFFYFVQLDVGTDHNESGIADIVYSEHEERYDDELLRHLLLLSTGNPLTVRDQIASPSPAASPCHPQRDSSLKTASEILNLGSLQLSLPPGETSDATAEIDARVRGKIKSCDVALVVPSKKWDTTVLSTLCRWRSCLCEAKADSSHLCPYHAEIKSFLDRRASANSLSESVKYLPRKIPNLVSSGSFLENVLGSAIDSRKDLTMIRAASTLLQELWDGKLKATLRSFLSKTAHDMRSKRRLESIAANAIGSQQCGKASAEVTAGDESDRRRMSNTTSRPSPLSERRTSHDAVLLSPKGTGRRQNRSRGEDRLSCAVMPSVPTTPVWAAWKDRHLLERITRESSEMRALLAYILGTEKLISNEVRSLSEMKVFPSQELLLIRKDLKAFKEKTCNSNSNMKVDHQGSEISEGRVGLSEQGSTHNNSNSNSNSSSGINSTSNNNNNSNILDLDFNSSLTNCLSEQLLAERKLSLLSERRKHEQEARITHAKKMAKIRLAQKTQSKDPSSFANQKRY